MSFQRNLAWSPARFQNAHPAKSSRSHISPTVVQSYYYDAGAFSNIWLF